MANGSEADKTHQDAPIEEQSEEPNDAEPYWVRTADISAEDLDAISALHPLPSGSKEPKYRLTGQQLLANFIASGYADSPIGGRATLELRGLNLRLKLGPEFVRVCITSPKGESMLREEIDGYFKVKKIELLSLAKTQPRHQLTSP